MVNPSLSKAEQGEEETYISEIKHKCYKVWKILWGHKEGMARVDREGVMVEMIIVLGLEGCVGVLQLETCGSS